MTRQQRQLLALMAQGCKVMAASEEELEKIGSFAHFDRRIFKQVAQGSFICDAEEINTLAKERLIVKGQEGQWNITEAGRLMFS